ncbi:hypothetical protein CCDG5_1905 [[Clostridium] cellulosi]|uniref:Radical SAM core domain-containing protein n=1 Tax=[Clostridium] cellulosi TaxID=29343 RepID=A0A078KUZ3_9FIRM|nr:hypothetical protein CCDG5_1905 [[Clostridium] cellulosi]
MMSNNYDFVKTDELNTAVINPDTGFWMILNSTALNIFKLYVEGKNEKEIVRLLSSHYGIPKDIIQQDVALCLDNIKREISKYNTAYNKKGENNGFNRQLTIHITNSCNLNCPYCFKDANHISKRKNLLSVADLYNAISVAIEQGFGEIVLTGGEPTIRTDFEEMLDQLSVFKSKAKFSLVTNGTTMLKDTVIDKMCSFFDSIQISLDSFDEEKNSVTRGKGSLAKISSFVNQLKRNGYKNFYYACTPYTEGMKYPSTVQDLPMMLRYAANTGSMGLYVNHLKPDGRMQVDDYLNFNEESFWSSVDKMYDEFSILYKAGFNKKDLGIDFTCAVAGDYAHIASQNTHSPNCGLGINELALDSDGNVYPCSALIFDEFIQGNIFNENFGDIIVRTREKFNQLTVDKIEKCNGCSLRMICGGGCRAMAYYIKGDLNKCDPNCDSCRKRILKWMNMTLISTANSLKDRK